MQPIISYKMDRFYESVFTEVLKVSEIRTISDLFSSDKYFSKIVARYVRKNNIKDMKSANIYYFMRAKNNFNELPMFYETMVQHGSNKCVKIQLKCYFDTGTMIKTFVKAVEMYYLDIIRLYLLAYKKDAFLFEKKLEYVRAVESNCTYELIELLLENDFPPTEQMFLECAKNRNFELMDKLREREMTIRYSTINEIAKLGLMDIIEWINNCSRINSNACYILMSRSKSLINAKTMMNAICTNNIALVKFLLDNNYKVREYDYEYAERVHANEIIELFNKKKPLI